MMRALCALLAVPLATGPAQGGTLDEAIRSNPTMAFARMLEIRRAEGDGGETWADPGDARSPDGAHLAIDTCHLSHAADIRREAAEYGPRDLVEHLRFLASYHHVASQGLDAMGYPAELWQGELDLFVAGLIEVALADESIVGARTETGVGYLTGGPDFEMRLASILDDHDAAVGADRPFADYEPWPCGGGPEYMVTVSTDPAGGSVYTLRRFSVDLCLALGLEPFSAECEGVLTPPSQAIGLGHYGFVVHWPQGEPSCGYVEFDAGPDDPPGANITVALNPPPGLCHGWN